MSTGDRLIYMANQIARNFEAEGRERAAKMVEDHIRLYWDPHMRARIVILASAAPGDLSPVAAAAVERIGAA
ncbi:formate dehydrogenase subunit delta [Sphingopyxis sp.]|uniref:formate dehydrogenase subunit delta n=1 Tax=Sphingopyxis sp. TaxID=1908224 RepID=UPI002D77E5C2|nr:formate dehydrogenase subunit delta [Sphingopyxis sp.]HET6523130.1 formate dehydrogenase subunit delta [Sphingopyxis sp.]